MARSATAPLPRPHAVVTAVDSEFEAVRFATAGVLLGEFRCPASDRRFRDAGIIRNFVVAFPRTAVWISRESEPPFVADPSVATAYCPGQAFERATISREGDHSDWFGVTDDVARELVRECSPNDAEREHPFRFARTPVPPRLYLAQRRLFTQLRDPEVDPGAIEEAAIAVVAGVVRSAYAATGPAPNGPPAVTRRAARDLAEGAKALILSRLFENLSVSDLAAALGVSAFHLCRVFRRVTGGTLHGYRRAVRLRVALGEASDARGDLSALAVRLGFYSHSHFTGAFRREFGTAPSAVPRNGP